MNLPNRLTVTRMVLTPVLFCWFFTADMFSGMPLVLYASVLVLLYAVMELSDLLDGKIARRYNLVTDLGKVMDPFADVTCHITFFTCFVVSSIMPVWAFALILWRELLQCFVRMLLMGRGKAMPANIFGKAKTCLYALCSICGLAFRIIAIAGEVQSWMSVVMTVLFALAAFSSVMSFVIYVVNTVKSGVLSNLTR